MSRTITEDFLTKRERLALEIFIKLVQGDPKDRKPDEWFRMCAYIMERSLDLADILIARGTQ
jgi:hypothetical protein